MLLSEAAVYIKSNIPVSSVVRLYGYEPDSRGFMSCPFHHDPTPSLKIYDAGSRKGWYCFGCHAGGSVIDFVMKLESCSFNAAVKAIDRHLNLGLLSLESFVSMDAYRRTQSLLDQTEQGMLDAADAVQVLVESRLSGDYDSWREIDMKPVQERTADEWTRYLSLRDEMDYLEYRLSGLDDFRKEVRSWRNSKRILKSFPGTPSLPQTPISLQSNRLSG